MPRIAASAFLAALLVAPAVYAEKSTVCTITVNSPDEREQFRRFLPEDKFRFVELVERGRPDWLASACRQKIHCDVLVVSGHFAGTEFYSSSFEVTESLPVDEMERAQCSASCPGLFSQVKEVYLFGCDTLKPEPVKSAMPEVVRNLLRAGQPRAEAERFARALSERHGESSRDLMRRIFWDVPVIYGFQSLAPYGRVAGPMLTRYFEAGGTEEVGTGRPSESLLSLFGPSSMTVAAGLRDTDPNADFRGQVCRYYDDRLTPAEKLAAIHRVLGGHSAQLRMSFDRVERFFEAVRESDRQDAAFASELAALAGDAPVRKRYLDLSRDTEDPALRVRMLALARSVGWLTAPQHRAELGRMVADVLDSDSAGYGEIDLICTLNKDRALDAELTQIRTGKALARVTVREAARACLGSAESRARVLKALASPDERDVRVAQAYLRHRPLDDDRELRGVAMTVAKMPGSTAQVRALETLARQRVADREVLEELRRLYTRASSTGVQRAIAEIFIRSGEKSLGTPEFVALLRNYRLSDGGNDLVDVLIAQLQVQMEQAR
jgi:hypothetical protein